MKSISTLLLSSVILLCLLTSLGDIASVPDRSSNNSIAKIADPSINQISSNDWLSGWQYREEHQIHNSTGAGINYQIQMTVFYGPGIDLGSSLYCDSNCQSDFDDIRFTDNDGTTLLDYWRESYFDSDNSTFWVEVADSLDDNVTIYIYYGNPDCSTTSDGDSVFPFFDDFNDDSIDLDIWDVHGPWTESGGFVSFSLTSTGSSIGFPTLKTEETWDMRNRSIVSRWRINKLTINREWGVSCADTPGDDHTQMSYFLAFNTSTLNQLRSYFDVNSAPGYDHYEPVIGQYLSNTFMTTEFVSAPNNVTKNSWIQDGDVVDTYSTYSFNSTPHYIFLGFYVFGWTGLLDAGNLEMDYDYVFIRSVASSEPIQGDWLEEEAWLKGWNFRKSHTILNATGAGVDYQVRFNVSYSWGDDSGDNVFCSENCQPDFDDIRFTEDDGISLLDYWREKYVDSEYAIFWVKIADSLDFDVAVFMYYGNTSVESISNGTATFIFFDDFETEEIGNGPDPNRWGIVGLEDGSNWVRIVQDPIDSSNQVLASVESGDGIANLAYTNNWGPVGSVAIGHKFRYDVNYKGYFGVYNESKLLLYTDQLDSASSHQQWCLYPDWYEYTPVLTTSTDTWYNWEYRLPVEGPSLYDTNTNTSYDGAYCYGSYSQPVNVTARFGLRHGANTWWTDDMYVRKYVTPEPVHHYWDPQGATPEINNPEDINYEAGFGDHEILWEVYNFNPIYYEVYRNSGFLRAGVMTGNNVSISVSNLYPGTYDYMVVITGADDVTLVDHVIVTVEDTTPPSLGQPPDIIYELGTTNHSIVWLVSDIYPDTYSMYRNGTLIDSDDWLISPISVDIDGLGIGDYNYTLVINDEFGNSASDTVIATVKDTTIPFLSQRSDMWYELGTTGNGILWTFSDLDPAYYQIFKDGDIIGEFDWTSDNYYMGIDFLDLGYHDFTIRVADGSGNTASDTVTVMVVDTTSPVLEAEQDVIIEFGTQDISLEWYAEDLRPDEYWIFRNDILVATGIWSNGNITYQIPTNLLPGTYNYTILVSDTSGNTATNNVIVIVQQTSIDGLGEITIIAITIGGAAVIIVVLALIFHQKQGIGGTGSFEYG